MELMNLIFTLVADITTLPVLHKLFSSVYG